MPLVKPLLSLLTLPVNFFNIRLISLVVNGICFSLAAAITLGLCSWDFWHLSLDLWILSFLQARPQYFLQSEPLTLN
jgi:putative membrane protein